MFSTDTRLTMAAALARAAALFPSRPAILDQEGNLTWSRYVDRIARAAAALHGLGLRPGDRFGILSHNSFRHAELINAGYWLGAVPVPLNFRLARPEIRYILDDADCKLLAVEDRFAALLNDEHFAPTHASRFEQPAAENASGFSPLSNTALMAEHFVGIMMSG